MASLRGSLRALLKLLAVIVSAVLAYAVAALALGLAPVNRTGVSPPDGVEIFLVSNGVHAAFAVPLVHPVADLRHDLPLPEGGRDAGDVYVIIGWGDARIYPSTQTWDQLAAGDAITALLGLNGTAIHVEHVRRPQPSQRSVRLRVSADGYRRLLAHISASLRRDYAGRFVLIPGASHGRRDVFYEALGRYTLIYTCNEWVREGLAKAGIRTARWSPFEAALFHHVRR